MLFPDSALPLVLHAPMHTVPDNREMVPAEGFVQKVVAGQYYLVSPLALFCSKIFSSFSTLALNSHDTLCQWICQRDGSACKAVFHCLPHCDGDNYCQVSFGLLSSALEGRGALSPARPLLMVSGSHIV